MIHRRTVANIWKDRAAFLNKEKGNAFATVKIALKAQYPLIYAKFLDFVFYDHPQRYPVASKKIEKYVLQASEFSNEIRFHASNGSLQRFYAVI